MSDSSISNDQSTNTDTVELRQDEGRRQAFQEQSEWYRLREGTLLCDCSNCIRTRELKDAEVGESVGRLVVALPKQHDISQRKIPDILSLFRFLLPSDEDIDEAIATSLIYP